MKLLVVYPYIPYPLNRGAYYRAFYFLKGLARDHEVDLFALSEKCEGLEHKDVFQEFCRKVEFFPFEHPAWEKLLPTRLLNPLPSTIAHWSIPTVQEKLSALLETGKYDAVHVCDIVLAQYFLKKHRDIPLIVDRTRVDLQYQLMEHKRMKGSLKTRILSYENFAKLWRYEKAIASRVAAEVVCGPDDETFVRERISRKVPIKVIPNGVDLNYFNMREGPAAARDAAPTLLFCGAMDYNPNIDALRWYFAEIHDALKKEIPDLQLLLVGKDPTPEVKAHGQKPGVTVTGGVPDVRPYYRRAWMQMVPLRIGGGTRLKIVESLAIGTPVVSTTIGAQGLSLRHNHDILLADTRESFVTETARALRDPSLREALQQQGYTTVKERLAWSSLAEELSRYYSSLIKSRNPLSPALTAKGKLSLA